MCTCVCSRNRDIIGNTTHHIRILSVLLRSGQWGEPLPDVLSSGIFTTKSVVVVFDIDIDFDVVVVDIVDAAAAAAAAAAAVVVDDDDVDI